MKQGEWQSAEQVAEQLGLHVRTVRGYIHDGRLKAVRIGKQYRISLADLDEFTGRQPSAPTPPRAEASTVVEIDDLGKADADRLGTLLVAGAQLRAGLLRVQAIYDDDRSRLRVIILGTPSATADVLQTLDEVLHGILSKE